MRDVGSISSSQHSTLIGLDRGQQLADIAQPVGQFFVSERIEKSKSMEDFSRFLFEVENIQLQPCHPHLQDIGHIRHFARSDRRRIANLFPNPYRFVEIQFE